MPADSGEPPFRSALESLGLERRQARAPNESKTEHIGAEHPVPPEPFNEGVPLPDGSPGKHDRL